MRNAVDLIESDAALIMNGDSYTDADLTVFANDYREAKADVSMLVVPADGRVDCGLVSIDSGGKVFGSKREAIAFGQSRNATGYT